MFRSSNLQFFLLIATLFPELLGNIKQREEGTDNKRGIDSL
jgi:hypothetical protein